MLVPWRIAIMMVDLPGARQERFTTDETDVLVRVVKDREMTVVGWEKPTQNCFRESGLGGNRRNYLRSWTT